MHNRIFFFAFLFVVGSLALPHAAHAAIPFFEPIVPPNIQQCAAGWASLIVVINNIIQFLLTLLIVFVAPVMIAYAGFLFVVNPVNPSEKQKAKSVLTNTILGIVIALSAWLIVDAIMAALYNGPPGTWASIVNWGGDACLTQEGLLQNLNQGTGAGGGTGAISTTTSSTGSGRTTGLDHGFGVGCSSSNDANVATLVGAGVSGHSSDNCCERNQSTCTSLDGMNSATVSQILKVKNRCGTAVVTGGTEVGHASEGGAGSHSSGAKVDIAQNLISCILGVSGSSSVTPPSFGTSQAKDRCGNIYTWEGNHTDIYVQSACSL